MPRSTLSALTSSGKWGSGPAKDTIPRTRPLRVPEGIVSPLMGSTTSELRLLTDMDADRLLHGPFLLLTGTPVIRRSFWVALLLKIFTSSSIMLTIYGNSSVIHESKQFLLFSLCLLYVPMTIFTLFNPFMFCPQRESTHPQNHPLLVYPLHYVENLQISFPLRKLSNYPLIKSQIMPLT